MENSACQNLLIYMKKISKNLDMNLKEFKETTSSEDKNTIAIDFDGVIHKSSKGLPEMDETIP